MPNRPAIDSHSFNDGPADRDRLVGHPDLASMSLCKFFFLVEFLIGFELFFTHLMKRLNHFFQCSCRARKSLNVALQISESPCVIQIDDLGASLVRDLPSLLSFSNHVTLTILSHCRDKV